MVEKYDYRKWKKTQMDEGGKLLRNDSCVEKFFNLSAISPYYGDDTYGFCLEYMEKTGQLTSKGRPKREFYMFTILVSQDGAKMLSMGKIPFPFDIVNAAAETLCAIRESLNEFKVDVKEAIFLSEKPLTPDYISPLWYEYDDVERVKVEDVEKYIKEKRSK